MRIYFEPGQEPLRNVPKAQRERAANKVIADMRERGLQLTGADSDGENRTIDLNLRNLNQAHGGNGANARQALVETLRELGVVRVDLAPGDIGYLTGYTEGQQITAHVVAAGLEDGDSAITEKCTSLTPDEVLMAPYDAMDTVLDRGMDINNPELRQMVESQVEGDMIARGWLKPSRVTSEYIGTPGDPLGPPPSRELQDRMGWGPANPVPYKNQWDSDDLE